MKVDIASLLGVSLNESARFATLPRRDDGNYFSDELYSGTGRPRRSPCFYNYEACLNDVGSNIETLGFLKLLACINVSSTISM